MLVVAVVRLVAGRSRMEGAVGDAPACDVERCTVRPTAQRGDSDNENVILISIFHQSWVTTFV